MSRIFISVLGTGLYTETTYYNPVQNKISPPGKFVQVAMLHQLDIIDQWTDDDRILILLTKEARTLNWTPTDNRRSNRTGDTVEYRGLKQEMENLNLKCRIIDIDIPNGMAADEMWNIFNTLYENIDYNDQLYFDLTHGFRYLPMMALVFSHYSKYLKNTAIKSISYGNFEARNSIGAPIVDLLPLLDLQEWTLAASEFTDNANTAKIKELTSNNLSPLIRQYKGTNEGLIALNQSVNNIDSLILNIRTCRLKEIYNNKTIGNTINTFNKISTHFIQPLNPILNIIKSTFLDILSDNKIQNGIEIARWCYINGLYQQCATLLQENIISAVCEAENIDFLNITNRNIVNSSFVIFQNEYPESEWAGDARSNKELVNKMLANPLLLQLAATMKGLGDLRNDINHAGMRNNATSTKNIRKKLELYIDTISQIVGNNATQSHAEGNTPHCLINLSNHPTKNWNKIQMQTALDTYSSVTDYPFPQITPNATLDNIQQLASDTLADITDRFGTDITIHVMGEMTFVYSFVNEAHSKKINCIASTSQRNVVEIDSNKKEVEFDFTTFRPYFY